MKLFKPLVAFILGPITLFLIPSANSRSCSPQVDKKSEINLLSDDKKCIDKKEKELLQEVEV